MESVNKVNQQKKIDKYVAEDLGVCLLSHLKTVEVTLQLRRRGSRVAFNMFITIITICLLKGIYRELIQLKHICHSSVAGNFILKAKVLTDRTFMR